MKRALLLLPFLILPLWADSASIWASLDVQSATMAQAIASRDTATLQELEHVVADEVSGLRRDPDLAGKGFDPFLDEISKQSIAARVAGHINDWKAAAADQQAFARAVQSAKALAAGKKP